jgi:hypothetical protein
MEPAPAFDASAPSPLRLWGFLLTVLGALLAGVGALLTWVTVGFTTPPIASASKGVDLWEGLVVLGCAVLLLVGILATRALRSRGSRTLAAAVLTGAGFVAMAIAGAFLVTAPSRFSPVDATKLVDTLARALGQPVDQVKQALQQATAQLGPYTTVGAGPWLALAGGVLGLVGGILALAWTTRRNATEDVTVPAEDASPTSSDEG